VLGSPRRHPPFALWIIMLAGESTREAVLKGLCGGADGYITKPSEPDALMAPVRSVPACRTGRAPALTAPAADAHCACGRQQKALALPAGAF
jgi:DNA-binding response OmpR family regulator